MSRREARQNRRAGSIVTAPLPVPQQIAGLQFWVRADKGVTIDTGVSSWTDSSGTGDSAKNLTQSTPANQPTLTASDASYGGKPSILFSGASVLLASQAWTAALAQPYTIIFVGHTTSNANAGTFFLDALNSTVQVNDVFGGQMTCFAGGGTDTWPGHGTFNTPAMTINVVNGSSSTIAINTRTPGFTGGGAGSNSLPSMVLGNLHTGGAGNTLTGPIAECAVYSGVLSAGNIDKFATYVAARYGLTIGA